MLCLPGWEFVNINGGSGTTGFFLNETGLQWTAMNGFAGWLGETFFFISSLLRFPQTRFSVVFAAAWADEGGAK